MKQILEYRDQAILETDEGPIGHPNGTWLLFKSAAGWQVLFAGDPGVVYSYAGEEAISSRDEAWGTLCGCIDEFLMLSNSMDKAQDFVPEMLQHKVNQAVQAGGFALSGAISLSTASLSMSFILRLHNGLAANDPLRAELRTQLQAQALSNGEVAGLMLLPSGELVYDSQRALVAIHRRKLARRVKAVQNHLDNLSLDLLSVLGNAAEETACLGKVDTSGEPLVDLVPLTAAARALTAVELPLLEALDMVAKRAREYDPLPPVLTAGKPASDE